MHGLRTFSNYLDTGKEIFEAALFSIGHLPFSIDRSFPNLSINKSKKNGKWNLENGKFPTFVRQISIYTSNLQDSRLLPSPLLPVDQKREKIIAAVDKINEKFGHYTVRNGFLLNAPKLKTVPNGYTGDF